MTVDGQPVTRTSPLHAAQFGAPARLHRPDCRNHVVAGRTGSACRGRRACRLCPRRSARPPLIAQLRTGDRQGDRHTEPPSPRRSTAAPGRPSSHGRRAEPADPSRGHHRLPGAVTDHWFEPLADHMGEAYLRYSFTKGTENEVEFIVDALSSQPGQRVLDVGCGPGRHAYALARSAESRSSGSTFPAVRRHRQRARRPRAPRSYAATPAPCPSTRSSTP